MEKQQTKVVIIGAGYAGLLAAVRLAGKARRLPVQFTLVNGSDVFVERLRLHEFAANRRIKRRPLSSVLRDTGIDFFQGRVIKLDAAERTLTVQTATGTQPVRYDYLLYALGSRTDRASVPGVR